VYLAECGFDVDAIDPNPAASVPAGSGISFSREGAENFERPDGSYRLVLCNKVLPFIASPGGIEMVLAKISRTLAPDGIAAFSLFGERDDWSGHVGVRTFTVAEAREAIAAAGLSVSQFWEQELDMAAAGATQPKHWHILRYLAARAA
jgi:2-polyprenyl-3-methyl-5-hydroxy-6-metoxy-1,4-benzoquinol methylase